MGLTQTLIRLLARVAVHTFFGEVDVVGLENLSKNGPVVIVGNHKNQFVDAMMVVAIVSRNVSFLIAEKSMHRPIIGDFAKAMDALPVIRAQDRARVIENATIVSFEKDACVLVGEGTQFTTQVAKGEQILLKGVKGVAPLAIEEVLSDTRLKVKAPVKPEDEADGTGGQPTSLDFQTPLNFKVIPKIDQKEVFGKTHDALCDNKCIGIFPEGGSSDRTDLLPLKAGVSVMALGAADRGAPVNVVPFGINYNQAHRWRSRVLVDVGKPIKVSEQILSMYQGGQKRDAYADFLKEVEVGLRGVTFNAPDKRSLNILRTMRRMYQGDIQLPPKRFMELNRRFGMAFGKFKEDERFLTLVDVVNDYMNTLKSYRLTDRQVATFPPIGSFEASAAATMNLFIDLFIVILIGIYILPGTIVFMPMFLRINHVVKKEVEKALAGSSVKVEARDVEASQKIMAAFIWVPVTIVFWTILIGGLTGGLWPKVSPYPPGSPMDQLFLNAAWIIPVAFFLFVVPYGFTAMLAAEAAGRRFVFLNRHFVVARSLLRPESSTAGRIRSARKDLALRIQDFFQELVIPSIPEWQQDPIINRETIVDRRRASDFKRAKEVSAQVKQLIDMEAQNPSFVVGAPGSPTAIGKHRTDLEHQQLRESIKLLDENIVQEVLARKDRDDLDDKTREGHE